MKKVLLFVLAAFFACYTMNAQVLFSEDFEGDLSAWTLVDSDGDGFNWTIGLSTAAGGGTNVHAGDQCVYSQSWDEDEGALTPDNWMITAQPITLPSDPAALKWFVYAQDQDYPDEYYSVYVGTTGTVNALSATSPVFSETLTAAGDWEERSVSLSAYAGQTVYIAFRHYNSSDVFWINIDDISVETLPVNPEITLSSLTIPSSVSLGNAFDITGIVTNNSSAALTSFNVTYSINGGTNAATYSVTGINVAYGETYNFTHNVPATINTTGSATISVTVSDPNGVTDNTADNTLSTTVSVCDVITAPYTFGFEDGLGCWSAISNNTENGESSSYGFGVGTSPTPHGGSACFHFSSYSNASDYTQYLISPELNLTLPCQFSFYYAARSASYPEACQVMYSTTNNNPSSFIAVGDELTVSSTSWDQATYNIPASAKYIALKYTVTDAMWYLGIDDISLTTMSTDPEIALTAITTPVVVDEGTSVNVSGTVSNNSAAALTSYNVVYTFDGSTSATYTVTGINVAGGESHNFTHNVPIANVTTGEHTLVVTVSNPNETADNTADNSLTTSVIGCGTVTTLPYHEGFDNAEHFGCWQNIDNDGDGAGWIHISEMVTDPSYTPQFSYNSTPNGLISKGYSGSFINVDNWMVSPAIQMPAQMPENGVYAAKWYAYNYYEDYPCTYEIHVATTNSISDLAASPALVTDAPGGEYTVNAAMLTNYAGQTIYIGIRHINSASDQAGYLFFDEFSIESVTTNPEIALTSATAPSTVAMNTAYVVNGTVVNNSATPLTSFDVACTVNGQTVNQQITGINVPYLGSYNFAIDMQGIATVGNYDVTMTVSNPNGVADITTDNTQTTSVNIYDASTTVPRTVLMENFTTAVCPNCPSGHDRIESAIGTTYANNVIWVSHHSGYYTDALTTTLDQTMMTFFNDGGATYAPAVMLDRTYWGEEAFTYYDGEYAPGPVFLPQNDVANALALATSQPAFVTVNVATPTYNATTRALSVTVSGNVSGALTTDDARLNVWLLEDGLLADGGTGVGHGPSQSGASGTFYHNHVIRENLSGDDWGEANIVNTTAGTNYTKTYTTTVSNSYDASKCYIVAFVSNGNHSNVNNCRVFNAGKSAYLSAGDTPGPGPQPQGIDDVNAANVKLYPNPTTGNLYIEVEGLQKVEVIDAVGRVVMSQNNGNVINMSNLANGIYTVRVMANGNTAVKKVVKK